MNRAEFESIENHFKDHADSHQASKMEKYMKGRYKYLGIRAPVRKDLLKGVFLGYTWTRDSLLALSKHCWDSPFREMQYCATDYLAKKVRKLELEDIPFLETLVISKSWWDTVDTLAVHPIGKTLKRDDDLRKKWVNKWSLSENMWLKRTAILHQLKYKEDVDRGLMEVTLMRANGSSEFFLNKAIGWMLREYSRTDPDYVIHFCANHKLSNLSRREALRLM